MFTEISFHGYRQTARANSNTHTQRSAKNVSNVRRDPPADAIDMLLVATLLVLSGSPLDDLLGLTPSMLDELRAELANQGDL